MAVNPVALIILLSTLGVISIVLHAFLVENPH